MAPPWNRLSLLCCLCVAACFLTPAHALDTLSVGSGRTIGWDGSGSVRPTIEPEYRALDLNEIRVGHSPGDLTQTDHPDATGSLFPRELEEENVAPGALGRGGSIQAPAVLDFSDTFTPEDLKSALEELLTDEPGGEAEAFGRKDDNAKGTLIIADLGARFGVSRIRFYPRNTVHAAPGLPYQNDFIRGYEFLINDGLNLTRDGFPIWETLTENTQNTDPVVDIQVDPPRYIRSIRLRSTTPIDFELDEIEVFGSGFLPSARYLSDIYEVGLSAWANISWREQAIGSPGNSRVEIMTRTGTDETPFVFTRKRADLSDAPEITASLNDPSRPMSRQEYAALPARDAQGVEWGPGDVDDDLENWSPWSTPYLAEGNSEAGTPILSPSPREYIQFQVRFVSNDIGAARRLDHVTLTYLTPPLADRFVAEIFPRVASASDVTTFTYAVRPVMETPGLRGFDSFEIFTPLRVASVDRIEILDPDGQVRDAHTFAATTTDSSDPDFQITALDDGGFSVRFPRIQEHDSLLKITFKASVLSYSTDFRGRASLPAEPGSLQGVVGGNSAFLGEGDSDNLSGITVLSPSIREGGLVDALEVAPTPFTPNGDGVNDRVRIEYNILTLTKAGRVAVEVFDLGGNRVRRVYGQELKSGNYVHEWDGTDSSGRRVAPGLYLLRVSVEGDNRSDARTRPLAVAY